MGGADDMESARNLRCTLTHVLRDAGFNLRKWRSSETELLEDSEQSNEPLTFTEDCEFVKVLGVQWNPSGDTFSFNVNFGQSNSAPTKRSILSESSRLFDPSGWLSPSTIVIKILYQKLWLRNLSWDEPVPQDISEQWMKFKDQSLSFTSITIPRCILPYQHKSALHGFCDASELAYAAVIYMVSEDYSGNKSVRLVAAKTKVSPIKQITINRLELCGAHLLSRLLKTVKESISIHNLEICAWTDSTTVLGWLSSPPRRWKCFIGNRTSQILDIIPRNCWNHVVSKSNPADCASRGLLPNDLVNFKLWWDGPEWLLFNDQSNLKSNTTQYDTFEEEKPSYASVMHSTSTASNEISELVQKHSSYTKLVRIIAYLFRFINQLKKSGKRSSKGPSLSVEEIQRAKSFLFKLAQADSFPIEVHLLKSNSPIPNTSKIASLNPFLDDSGFMRVGGRLHNANISYSRKHPIILARHHHLTVIIAQEYHTRFFHVGPHHLTSLLQGEYWIPGCRQISRATVKQCVRCHRFKQHQPNQIMGNLPSIRVNQAVRPFIDTGIDYAGPIWLKNQVGRAAKKYKGYISIFICLATKAMHIELVSDMTTEAFIAALRRFTSRRGKPTNLYSDNGTTFVGAYRELKELLKLLESQQHHLCIQDHLSTQGINWNFIPPHAPHFGGMWESGVKSIKTHLRRVVGSAVFTFEQMNTFLSQVESILNSRPLTALSSDPENLDVLTPGHFLIGQPLTQPPEPNLMDTPTNRLSRYQLIQSMVHGFWKIWRNDYLSTLQQRYKWKTSQPNIKVGDMVLLKQDALSPNHWPLGRITKCMPGSDGFIRVVNVRTAGGVFTRPIVKVVPLPINS